jgi:adenosylmethionine-8-amino-7-oxononanoate aminotransferase
MSAQLNKFPNAEPPPYAVAARGVEITLEDGRTLLDATSGMTGFAVLGYSHPIVLAAMAEQMSRYTHLDLNLWRNRTLDELAELLLTQAPAGLDRIYFCGSSGSEAVEAALKLSYQAHHDEGHPEKSWIISREDSFHGATLQAMAVSDLPILKLYGPQLPAAHRRIVQHNPYRLRRETESLDDYAARGAHDLEQAILEIGPDKVGAFVGETMLGTLVGNVPPAPGYWRSIREVCDRYNVHLILDEVYCGLGRSGKVYCCAWDEMSPDFLCMGKNLGAGYAPLSAVALSAQIERIVAAGSGRINHGHTHQGFALGAAAALAVQRIVQAPDTLARIREIGTHISRTLTTELETHPMFRNVRGRGAMQSLEYDCREPDHFGRRLAQVMRDEHGILIDGRWHRASIVPAYTISDEQLDRVLDRFVATFKRFGAG